MTSWYEGGLSFACTRCGNCCTGSPGYVWVSPEEIRDLANALALDEERFRARYTRLVHGVVSLVEKRTGECVFLTEDRRCAVNAHKPRQCVTFPFWPRQLASPDRWKEAAQRCPGIGSGPLYTREQIDRIQDRATSRATLCRILGQPPA